MKKKIFECKNVCKQQQIEAVLIGCKDCIKKYSVTLTSAQQKAVRDIILKNNFKYNL